MRLSRLDRSSQAFNQRLFIERLAQKADRSAIERAAPVFLIRVSGNQNDWHMTSLRLQCVLQVKATQTGHLHVSDQACRIRDQTRLEEMLGRFESNRAVSQGFDKLAYAVTGKRVIIND